MFEAGVVVGKSGEPIHWHVPLGRTGGSLPDSRDLWEVIWGSRDSVDGFAHTHPGFGPPGPSWEDVTTFAAVESALGRRLNWWIASGDRLALARWEGPGRLDYRVFADISERPWLHELRRVSGYFGDLSPGG